jgi:hypothetical protein
LRPQLEALEDRCVPSTLNLVSGATPFTDTSDLVGQRGHVSLDSEVEPRLAVDPTNSQHFVAVWQQDRWSNGGARGIAGAVSTDGGNTWLPMVIPGLTLASGGAYQRASDPWVSISKDGTVYVSSLEVTLAPAGFPLYSAVMVNKSTDGGLTWGQPTVLQADTSTFPNNIFNDKESVTVDPTDPSRAFVVWDRNVFPGNNADFEAFHAGVAIRQDVLLSITQDGGKTWTTNTISSPNADFGETGNQIVVLPDGKGTLVDVFSVNRGSGNQPAHADQIFLATMRSTDHGATWSDPILGPAQELMDVTDPNTGAPVRTGEQIPEVAVNRQNGALYAVWADGRFSNFTHDDIAMTTSTDGGLTWSAPIKVNQTPTNIPAGDQQAFSPNVAVADNGTVAVAYYDFRNNTGGPGLPTDYWMAQAAASNATDPASWSQEDRLTNASFNLELTPRTSRGYFVGDYEGLVAVGNNFDALFAQAGADASDPSNIWFRDPPAAPAGPAARTDSQPLKYVALGNFIDDGLSDLAATNFDASVVDALFNAKGRHRHH